MRFSIEFRRARTKVNTTAMQSDERKIPLRANDDSK